MPKPTLEDLTKAGEAVRDAARHERAMRVEQQVADLDAVAQRATSPLGMFAGKGALFILFSIGLPTAIMILYGLAVPLSKYSVGGGTYANPAIQIGTYAGAITGAFIAVIVAARIHVPIAVRRELAWVKSLPFELVNHWKLLGDDRARFVIDFLDAKPPRDLFTLAVDGAATPTARLEVGDSSDPPYSAEIACAAAGPARARWRGCRRLVETLFVPLHERYPIAIVSFR